MLGLVYSEYEQTTCFVNYLQPNFDNLVNENVDYEDRILRIYEHTYTCSQHGVCYDQIWQ